MNESPLKTALSSRTVSRIYAVLTGLLFLHHFVILLFYPVWAAGAQKLTPVWAVFALIGVLLGRLWRRRECWILGAFLVLMAGRAVLAQRGLPAEAVIILSAALYSFLIAYAAPLLLPEDLRKPALTVFCGVWTAVTAALAVLGVILCWTGARLTNLSGEFFGLTSYGRLGLFSNPNITGGFFACGVLTALMAFTLVKSRALRALCIVAALPMIMATSLSGTRCASIAISVALGLLICLALQKPLKRVRFRYGILALVFLVCFAALTLAQIRFNGYFIQFRNSARGALIAVARAEENPAPVTYIQQRGGLNFSSLDDLTSGRIGIWADGFRIFTQSPLQMLFGDSVLNPGLKTLRMNHYHNLFLQILFESGILGFLLFGAFLVFFLIRALRLIRQEDRPLWQRFLPAPALAILAMELLDCLTLFANGHVPMTLLYLFMGATVAVSEPEKKTVRDGNGFRGDEAPAAGIRKSALTQDRGSVLRIGLVVLLSLWIGAAAFVVNRRNALPLAAAAALLGFAVPCFLSLRYLSGKPLLNKKYRKYAWAGLALASLLWVLFSLNNSSIGLWRELLLGQGHGTLFGTARVVRGDEWAVWTPFLFSQANQGFPAVNTAIGAANTDPTLIAIGGLPAWNLAAVFKPFYWGFLLLGAERGYSLMTLLRVLCLAAVSFAAAKRYTRGNTPLSVAAAFLITLSPYVQWWFSQSICEVLIFSQAAVLCWLRGFETGSAAASPGWKRLGFGVLGAWCLGCFALVLYPAWLIPVLYLMIAVLILYGVKRRKSLRAPAVLQTLAPLAVTALLLFLIVRNSWPTLMRIQASVYPGRQTYSGGDRPLNLFTGLYALTFPLAGPKVSTASDLSSFVSFFPVGILLTGFRFFRRKKRDTFSVVLLCFMAVFTVLALVRLPEWLTKVTLLNLCTRPVMIISLCDLLLLFRALSFLFTEEIGQAEEGGNAVFRNSEPAKRLIVAALCLVAVAGGAFVNPIQRGFGSVETLPPVQAAADLPADTILAVEADWPVPDSLLFSGKPVLNSTHPYADPDQWRKADPEGVYEDVWNRLCHVSLEVAGDQKAPKFELLEGDHIKARLTAEELRALGAQALVTQRIHPELTLVSDQQEWKVYSLEEAPDQR